MGIYARRVFIFPETKIRNVITVALENVSARDGQSKCMAAWDHSMTKRLTLF